MKRNGPCPLTITGATTRPRESLVVLPPATSPGADVVDSAAGALMHSADTAPASAQTLAIKAATKARGKSMGAR